MNYWQGKRIRLRGIEPDDAKYFYGWNLDNEWGRGLDFVWPPASRAAVESWAKEQSEKQLEDDQYHWMIETLDGVPVGSIDTHHCNPRYGTFSYGIGIGPEHRRQGYAREAIFLVLKYYFEELRYQKVTVAVHSHNEASIQLHEGLGFELEGTHRRMGYTQGGYFDVLWYGMTAEEFHERFPEEPG